MSRFYWTLRARPVFLRYGETLEFSGRAYSLEEIAAEKLRAARQTQSKLAARAWARPRARNFYDLWYLSQQREQVDWTKVSSILPRKSAVRGVSITSLADVFQPTLISDVRASWTGTLGQIHIRIAGSGQGAGRVAEPPQSTSQPLRRHDPLA